jgi:hypothetical protein
MPHLGIVGWSLVVITGAVLVGGGVNAGASITNTIMTTGGQVTGVVIGGLPQLVNGFQDGIDAGSGGENTGFSFTGDQNRQQPRDGGLNAVQDKPRRELNR